MARRVSKVQPNQLVNFGLNPNHWQILEEAEKSVEFINIDDSEMRFIASLDSTTSVTLIDNLEWII